MDDFQGIVSIDVYTTIFVLINFVIVYLIVKKLLYNPVKKIIKAREDDIKERYRLADESKQNAYDLEKHYELAVKNAKDEATKIINLATRKANVQSEEIIEKANKNSINIIKKAHIQMDIDRKKLMNELRDDISDIAMITTKKVIGKNITQSDQLDIIEKIIDDLKEGDI